MSQTTHTTHTTHTTGCSGCKQKESARKYAWRCYFRLREELYDQAMLEITRLKRMIQELQRLSNEHDFIVPTHFKEEMEQCLRDLRCPVCMDEMTRVTFSLTPCFHKVCENCIMRIKETSKCCPICRKPLV